MKNSLACGFWIHKRILGWSIRRNVAGYQTMIQVDGFGWVTVSDLAAHQYRIPLLNPPLAAMRIGKALRSGFPREQLSRGKGAKLRTSADLLSRAFS